MPFFSVTLNLCLTLEELTKRKQLTNGSRRRRRCFASFARIIQCFCYRQKSGHAHLLFYLHTWLFGSVCLFAATAVARIPKYKHITRTHPHTHTRVHSYTRLEQTFHGGVLGSRRGGRVSLCSCRENGCGPEFRPKRGATAALSPSFSLQLSSCAALAFDFDCSHFNHVDE